MHSVATVLHPLGPLVVPTPAYEHRDSWRFAGTMVDLLIHYLYLGGNFDPLSYTDRACSAELALRDRQGSAPANISQCLASIAVGNLEGSPRPGAGEAVTASFALALAEHLYRSGEWPPEFQALLSHAGAIAAGPQIEESDVVAVASLLEQYWRAIGDQALFDDVSQTLRAIESARQSSGNELARLKLMRAMPPLRHASLLGGADPDIFGEVDDVKCILEVKNITGCISSDHVRQLLAYVMLSGDLAPSIETVGVLYSRRSELRICPTRSLFGKALGSEDVAHWSGEFGRYLTEAYALAT